MPTYEERMDDYYARLETRHLGPLWNVIQTIMTREPRPRSIPFLWKWGFFHKRPAHHGTTRVGA